MQHPCGLENTQTHSASASARGDEARKASQERGRKTGCTAFGVARSSDSAPSRKGGARWAYHVRVCQRRTRGARAARRTGADYCFNLFCLQQTLHTGLALYTPSRAARRGAQRARASRPLRSSCAAGRPCYCSAAQRRAQCIAQAAAGRALQRAGGFSFRLLGSGRGRRCAGPG